MSLADRPDYAALLREGPEALQDPLWPTFLATEKHRWISGMEGMMGEAEEARGGGSWEWPLSPPFPKVLFLTKAS